MLYAIVGMLVIIFDQVVKYWVDKNINWADPIRELVPGVISLVRVQNDGAAFSFLAGGGARFWFVILTGIFTVVVIIALVTNFISGKFGRWCLVLITAGGLSNCIDRVLYGYVLDMFKVDLFNFAVFNVADIFITVFAILFILYILFGGEKEAVDPDEFDIEDTSDEDPEIPVKRSRKEIKAKMPDFVSSNTRSSYSDNSDASIKRSGSSFSKEKINSSRDESTERVAEKRRAINNRAGYSNENAAAQDEFEAFFAPKKQETAPSQSVFQKAIKHQSTKPVQEEMPDVMPVKSDVESSIDSSDPFAEWDRANGRTSFDSVSSAKAEYIPAQQTPAVQKPTAPVSSDSSSSLDLDSILNEFK